MGKSKKETPDLNASSTADIAFLLLVFFLVSTTMNSDTGLSRMLPPLDPNQKQDDSNIIKDRNIFTIQLNYQNQLLVEGEWLDQIDLIHDKNVDLLKEKAKEFIANPLDLPNLPEKQEKEVEFFGNVKISKGIISLQNDRGSQYQAYLKVQNQLQAAYNELRNELAKTKFNKEYDKCSEDEQKAIREIYPQKISEAEPKNYKK